MLIISAHGDTNFLSQSLKKHPQGIMEGHLDNFSGVYATMKSYFSGRLTQDYVHIEITWGEERDMEGARELRKRLKKHDVVLVVDVTGTHTDKDFVIEKCKHPALKAFLQETLDPMTVDIYENCPDPVCNQDEVDVYQPCCPYTCFLGIPCFGGKDGDYNAGMVQCKESSLDAVSEAICRIAGAFPSFCEKNDIPVMLTRGM